MHCKSSRHLPVLIRYRDGSYLSVLDGTKVRVIDAPISITTTAGHRTGTYRLITTLLEYQRYPAAELITLYHQRWEIETAYLEINPASSADESSGPALLKESSTRSTPSS